LLHSQNGRQVFEAKKYIIYSIYSKMASSPPPQTSQNLVSIMTDNIIPSSMPLTSQLDDNLINPSSNAMAMEDNTSIIHPAFH
jgi:hypothetical protein